MQVNTVITKREDPGISSNAIAKTRADEPDVKVITLPAWRMVAIRVARVYLQSLLGFLTTAAVGVDRLQADDLLATIWLNAGFAIAPAFMSLLMNAIEILNKWDITNPEMRA